MYPKNGTFRKVGLMVFLLLAFPSTVFPKYSGPMRFSIFWPCSGNGSFCGKRILAEGTIGADTADKFTKFLAGKEKPPYYLPPKPTVCFDSPGGSVVGAIKLGNSIREHEFDTCIESEYRRVGEKDPSLDEVFQKNAICASACVFAFAGGVHREVGEKARIGVHQFAGTHGAIGDGLTQITVVALAGYLEQMGVKRILLDIASLHSPDNLYWLSTKEISQVRLENMSVELSKWQLGTTGDGSVFAYISQQVPENNGRTTLMITKNTQKPRLVILFEPESKTMTALDDAITGVDEKQLWLEIDGKVAAVYKGVRWMKGKNSITTMLDLSDDTLQQFRSGKTLRVFVHTVMAFSQYDPSLDFPLGNVSSLLPAVLK